YRNTRREFLRDLGIGAAALPFVLNLPSLAAADTQRRKQRLVIMFSPDGVVPSTFWPDEEGASFTLKESLKPLEPFRGRTLILHGVCDRVRGDGDNHMRGMGCLLTGAELFPGNVQGGSDTPAGWASGISIDQEIEHDLRVDLNKVRAQVTAEDRQILDEHASLVRQMEQELRTESGKDVGHAVPVIEPGVKAENDNIPRISKLQIDLLVNSFSADFARV